MDNVIGVCYVVEDKQFGAYPAIYLARPEFDEEIETLHLFYDPFSAKNFIQHSIGSRVEVVVSTIRDWHFESVQRKIDQ